MSTLFISLLTLVLLVVSAFVVLIVLMQRTSQSGGMGAALGGGAAESAFGADTNNMLTKGTIYGIFAFFLCSLVLYLLYQAKAGDQVPAVDMATLITGAESTPVSGAQDLALPVEVAAEPLSGEVIDAAGLVEETPAVQASED